VWGCCSEADKRGCLGAENGRWEDGCGVGCGALGLPFMVLTLELLRIKKID